MRTVLVMRGLPGSGKTTFLKGLARGWTGAVPVVCSADDYFVRLGGGKYLYDPAKIGEAHADCFRKFLKALAEGEKIVVCDNTNSAAYEAAPYMMAAAAHRYEAAVVQFSCTVEEAAARNVHGCPRPEIERMTASMSAPLPAWWTVLPPEEAYRIMRT